MIKNKLVFGKGNAKLDSFIRTFSLTAGYSCPMANNCLSFANRETGKIKDGKNTEFRCFAASSESIFPNVRKSRWDNFESLKACKSIGEMVELIQSSIPANTSYIRTHVSGDFFNEMYFKAWMTIVKNNPDLIVYGYTKRIDYLIKFKKQIPINFRFTASYGGKLDHLISPNKLVSAKVVYSANEAKKLGLEIDHDDSHAISNNKSFALLIHGMQPSGSIAGAAVNILKKSKSNLQGVGGYSKTKRKQLTLA